MMLTHLHSIESKETNSGLDIKKILQIYDSVSYSQKDSDLLVLYVPFCVIM